MSESGKFIPSLDVLRKAAMELPPAENITVDSYQIAVENKHFLEFRKIKFKTKSSRGYRWVYEGKILVK